MLVLKFIIEEKINSLIRTLGTVPFVRNFLTLMANSVEFCSSKNFQNRFPNSIFLLYLYFYIYNKFFQSLKKKKKTRYFTGFQSLFFIKFLWHFGYIFVIFDYYYLSQITSRRRFTLIFTFIKLIKFRCYRTVIVFNITFIFIIIIFFFITFFFVVFIESLF